MTDERRTGGPGAEGAAARPAPAPSVYRDEDEFNTALDAAAESINPSAGNTTRGQVIFWSLVAVQVFLYASGWILGWDVRRGLVPGVDLTRPVWLVIVLVLVFHHVWTRQQHGRILRGRLCFGCGRPLFEVPVDEQERGACPQCGREFDLGQYRRPVENRGRRFRGYVDADHFDKTMYAAAEHLKKAFHGWSISGITAGARQLDGSMPVDEEIGSQLIGV